MDREPRIRVAVFKGRDGGASDLLVFDDVATQSVLRARKQLPPFTSAEFLFERFRLVLEIGAENLRTERGEEQNQAKVAESVGNRVCERRIGDQLRLHVIGNR